MPNEKSRKGSKSSKGSKGKKLVTSAILAEKKRNGHPLLFILYFISILTYFTGTSCKPQPVMVAT